MSEISKMPFLGRARCDSRLFVDRLENLAQVLAVVLQLAQEVEPELLANSNPELLNQFESSITQVRIFAEKLERQFNRLEYLVATQTAGTHRCRKEERRLV